MDAVDKGDERKFYEAAGMWTLHSSEKETETLVLAAMRYFAPGGCVSKRRSSDHDADTRLILKGIALGDIAGVPYEAVGAASVAKDDDPYLYRRLRLPPTPLLRECHEIRHSLFYAVLRVWIYYVEL